MQNKLIGPLIPTKFSLQPFPNPQQLVLMLWKHRCCQEPSSPLTRIATMAHYHTAVGHNGKKKFVRQEYVQIYNYFTGFPFLQTIRFKQPTTYKKSSVIGQ
jgi:hypothetical protein